MPAEFTAVILADCGPSIGLGHLRRSLVIALALQARGGACLVLTPDASGETLSRKANMAWGAWPADLAELPGADVLIADSYRLPIDKQRSWRDRFRIRLLVDDLADRELDADIILNGNLYGDPASYRDWPDSRMLIGAAYAPIDPVFFAARGKYRPLPARALVSFGGTDDGRLSTPVTTALLSSDPNIHIDLTISPLHEQPSLSAPLAQNPRLRIHHGGDMPLLMSAARLYIGAAGTTILEAAAAGVPCVAIQLVENQSDNIDLLKKAGTPTFTLDRPEDAANAAIQILRENLPNPLSEGLMPGGSNRIADAVLQELRRK
jgi:UDP-2,4-diacetamido-2,4,6-trideoxy-beta-L-altropyranose hydrolase